ncbi:Aspartyl/glutamyl-tRNA(Asn/Gln) amidotransferase subunit B [Gracilaria domingensis]|nr:Aspartyl/glutamyl-tRNA(Asn/Gln) amidotransferase subunit B [Gracilaria domingensis]
MARRVAAFVFPSSVSPFFKGGASFSVERTGHGSKPIYPCIYPKSTVKRCVRMTTTQAPEKKSQGRSKKGKRSSGKREKKGFMSPGLLKALEKYEPIIGIEMHVQLSTKTKAYCNCSTKAVRTPNTNICPVCMGHPGALPVVNSKVVELAAKAGMALGCSISEYCRFDRKNYYYVDTPKNYQITQDTYPIAKNGSLRLATFEKRIGITRLHMEEDSAKMTHGGVGAAGRLTDSTHSLLDFNRSGIPLVEIVSEPDIRTGSEAAEYGQELQRVLRYVGTSDCNMQDGSLRCDVNVSIRPKGAATLGTKVELKNLNSFASAQKSIDFEIERQAGILDNGGTVRLETRTWDEKENETKTMRVKEGASDYRYFPEPDIPPLHLSQKRLEEWRKSMPELPAEKRERYQQDFGLSGYDAFLLSDDVSTARYFEESINSGADPKQAANWIMGDITKVLKSEKIDLSLCKLTPANLANMIGLIDNGVISGKIAKDLIVELVMNGGVPSDIVEESVSHSVTLYDTKQIVEFASLTLLYSMFVLNRDLKLISDPGVIRELAATVIEENPKELAAFKDVRGKTRLFGFFVGKTLAASDGKGDPVTINSVLKEMLES